MQNGLDDAYAHVRKALAAIERCVLDQPCELREQLDDASRFLTAGPGTTVWVRKKT